MTSEFWLGTFLSIPIGLATSLATPWFQNKLDSRSKQRSLIASKNLAAEYEQVSYYRSHPEDFTQYLIHVAIKTTFIGAMLGIISGISFAFAQVVETARTGLGGFGGPDILRLAQDALYVLGQFSGLVGSILIVNICRPALSMWTKVRNFAAYEKGISDRGLLEVARPASHS
jgi:hypothetical protein